MRGTDTAANGDRCPVNEAHGKMFMLPSGRQFCAVQQHDNERTAHVFEFDGVTPAARAKENAMAFELPDGMKSALDPVPTQVVSSRPAPVKAGVPSGGAGVVCRKPSGKVGKPCGNCGRTLLKSDVRKSGLEHGR